MVSNTVSYKILLKNLTDKEKVLGEKHNFIIHTDSWYWEAAPILKELISVIKKGERLQSDKDDNYWNRIFTSLGLLLELSGVLDVLDLIEPENLKIFLLKLKLIFKSPLLMNEEDTDTNLGRNTLFELGLFSRFMMSGYDAKLHYEHPDISVRIDAREYDIECKRLYKPETLIKNTKAALDQLLEYSIYQPKPEGLHGRYGIVAVSLSRYFHPGDMLFDATTEEKAKERINYEMKKVFDDNEEELRRLFPVKVPALILHYSDRGSIDKPYIYNFIDLHETARAGSYSHFKQLMEDFKNFK